MKSNNSHKSTHTFCKVTSKNSIFTQIYLHTDHDFYGLITLAVSGTGTGTETCTVACMVLCRTFHTAPEQGQGPTCIASIVLVPVPVPVPVPDTASVITPLTCFCTSLNKHAGSSPCPGTGHSQCDYTITSLVYDSYVRSKRPKSLPVLMKRAVRWRDYSNGTTTSAQ